MEATLTVNATASRTSLPKQHGRDRGRRKEALVVASSGASRRERDAPLPEVALLAARPWAQAEALGRDRLRAAIDAASDEALGDHPAVLLQYARACEPGMRLVPRRAALDRLTDLLEHRGPGRPLDDLRLEVLAERAHDEARDNHLDLAESLAREVLDSGPWPDGPARRPARGDRFVAMARATDALGRALAWRGDRPASSMAEQHLLEAARYYRRMGATEWEGYATFWSGNSVHFQWGDLATAELRMGQALEILAPDSPRRATVLTFYADVLLTRGRWAEVDVALEEAMRLATTQDDAMGRAYVAWTRARVASARGDAGATVRSVFEAERHRSDWFEINTGAMFLADAAELLDRVGERQLADAYLTRAEQRDPDDEFVAQAAAALLARRGDPEEALRRLRRLVYAPWLEKRLVWRHTLLAAYATLRNRHHGAGALAARALDQAVEIGGPEVALVGEAEMVAALAPLAAAAGSAVAVSLLAPADGIIVRLLGEATVWRGGEQLVLPTGGAGALVRLLALSSTGLEIDEVIDALWPEADMEVGRRRLRDARTRLGARSGELVRREGSRLRLVDGWVDAVAFRQAADRAMAARSEDASSLLAAGLALWTGDPLPSDPYADWAAAPRSQLRRRHLQLVDLAAEDAVRRNSLDEACALVEEAVEAEPYEEHRYLLLADLHTARGRLVAARRALVGADLALARLELQPSPELQARLDA
jgi:DNA-binding SARP family transcriptional activator/tetratricopeptide (TPR) repeat protein